MTYISNTPADREAMLASIGITSIEDLLEPLPKSIRLRNPLNMPEPLNELSLVRHLAGLASRNSDLESHICFLGAGIYDHFRPSVVAALSSRGEFATAYTPYQPELSQGMLQALYEYQTLICALTGMEVANASMYDGACGMAEAALMAISLTGRREAIVAGDAHPLYRQVLHTYLHAAGCRVVETDYRREAGSEVASLVGPETACVIFQQPGFFGTLTDCGAITGAAHSAGALAIAVVDPVSLALLKPPAEYDADIVVGEGQSLGNAMGFGGPLLGFFACKMKYARSFPGRIVGATHDEQGRRGYTMTLRTREQDIRREKATSNICTNQTLLAIAATIYLCEVGREGLREVAEISARNAHYARQQLHRVAGASPLFPQKRHFKEFAVRLEAPPEKVNRALLKHKIVGGLPLGRFYPELSDSMLIAVTENRTRAEIDLLANGVKTAAEINRGTPDEPAAAPVCKQAEQSAVVAH
ncbi:MAG TPA: aminomethyl-transferring glycine dehydrogenase subunit GcvPA [Chthonomonadales bacterium]|nr:aminomethyl-transferring glycine dehydrogenase subunit GcvPA [Chthonomonadales bacterium]